MDGLWTVLGAWALMALILIGIGYQLLKEKPVLSTQERELLATLWDHEDIPWALGKVSEEVSE